MFLSRAFKIFLVVLVAFAFASVATAYAAVNTVPATNAGDGAGTISGYTISAVHYDLNATNPQNIDSVTFTVNTAIPSGSTVKIKLVDDGSTWYTCTVAGGTSVTCTTTGATVLEADSLRVVIAD